MVGAPAFMRGKERFSAPGKTLDLIMRFSAGNPGGVQQIRTADTLLFTRAAIQHHPGKE